MKIANTDKQQKHNNGLKLMFDIEYNSVNRCGESLCGDSFLRLDQGDSTLIIHSDGLGHGERAHSLSRGLCSIVAANWNGRDFISNLTETLNSELHKSVSEGFAYATFTIIELNHKRGRAVVVEFENPPTLFFRENRLQLMQRHKIETVIFGRLRKLFVSEIDINIGDTLIVYSDGVTLSGVGKKDMQWGWQENGVLSLISNISSRRQLSILSVSELAARISERAIENDRYYTKDDISVVVVRLRQ